MTARETWLNIPQELQQDCTSGPPDDVEAKAHILSPEWMEQVNNPKFSFLINPAVRDLNHIGCSMAIPLVREMRCSTESEVYTPQIVDSLRDTS